MLPSRAWVCPGGAAAGSLPSGSAPEGAVSRGTTGCVTMMQPAPAAADTEAGISVPLFKDGAWTTFRFDAHTQAQEEEWDKALKALGFELWMSTDGMTGCLDALPLSLRLWARSEAPRFLVEVNTLDAFDHVLAHDLPAAMEVLARWAPVIQSLAVAGLIGDANQVDNHEHRTLIGLVRQILGQH